MYDPRLGRWTTIDPLIERFAGVSPYTYCLNNPVNLIDPDGASPYFDKYGKFLGVDENGYRGKIYITTADLFNQNSSNGIADSEGLQQAEGTLPINEMNSTLSNQAEAMIYMHILREMRGYDFDRLHNGSVSIYRGSRIGNKWQGYNDPQNASRFMTDFTNPNDVIVTAEAHSYMSTLYNVEGVQSYLGIHEYNGHGIKHYSDDTKNHYKAYLDQYKDPTFKRLDASQQKELINNMLEYMQVESPTMYRQYKHLKNQ